MNPLVEAEVTLEQCIRRCKRMAMPGMGADLTRVKEIVEYANATIERLEKAALGVKR